MVAAKKYKLSPRMKPSELDKLERDKRTQPMTEHQMALIMSVGEMDAGPVGKVLMEVADTKKIDGLSAGQCRSAATKLGLIKKYKQRLKK